MFDIFIPEILVYLEVDEEQILRGTFFCQFKFLWISFTVISFSFTLKQCFYNIKGDFPLCLC